MKIKIGTRGSKLALVQTEIVRRKLERIGVETEVVVIKTRGDRGLWDGTGVFVKEIEKAILEGYVDVGVHSAKDLPTAVPKGLKVTAYIERESPADCVVGKRIRELGSGTKVGTSSLRREKQIKAIKPEVEIVPLRGNIDTRIKKVEIGFCDSAILGYAGLKRLGFERYITEILDPLEFIPAPGQGAIVVETREDEIAEIIATLDHKATRLEVETEREFIRAAGGGCRKVTGAVARYNGKLSLKGMVFVERLITAEGEGDTPKEVALKVWEEIRKYI